MLCSFTEADLFTNVPPYYCENDVVKIDKKILAATYSILSDIGPSWDSSLGFLL